MFRSATAGGAFFGAMGVISSLVASYTHNIFKFPRKAPIPFEVLGLGAFFGGSALFSSFVVIIHQFQWDKDRKDDSSITKSGAVAGLIGGLTTGIFTYQGLTFSEPFNYFKLSKYSLGSALAGITFGYFFCLPVWRFVIAQRSYGNICIPPSWDELQRMRYKKSLSDGSYRMKTNS